MRKKNKNGYDLEFPDADGRTTLYGHLNENNLDGKYLPGLDNGFYAVMALGTYSAFAYAANDPEADKYLYGALIKKRKLHEIALRHMKFIDLGLGSNFSNYNMVFTAAWLAARYLKDEKAIDAIRETIETQLYANPGATLKPIEMKQSLFDFIYSASKTRGTAFSPASAEPDRAALDRGLETLREFPAPPFWEFGKENCDAAEISSGECILDDGSKVKVLGKLGWKEELIAGRPIPMRVRPASNYYWRSCPYAPNGGGSGGSGLFSGSDFRIAYWLARWTKLAE